MWEAVYFDHSLPGLIDLADRAAEIGVERYVLDDGWFLAEVERCEARLAELRGSPLWAELCAASGGDAETDEPPAKRQAK